MKVIAKYVVKGLLFLVNHPELVQIVAQAATKKGN